MPVTSLRKPCARPPEVAKIKSKIKIKSKSKNKSKSTSKSRRHGHARDTVYYWLCSSAGVPTGGL